ncbi:hypothetical protein LJC07_07495 [Christensenellaceae bacterium OttesenSCG-928-L17]|nr:hypothetical protein [Christensenellaceae bacterium OttesenSCG-928-L17]
MKKRIFALTLAAIILCVLCIPTLTMARGALNCQSNVISGNSYARITSFMPENLYVEFSLYKIVSGVEQFQCSASGRATPGTSATARSNKSLSSGYYVMYIYGYGDTHTVNETRYYQI